MPCEKCGEPVDVMEGIAFWIRTPKGLLCRECLFSNHFIRLNKKYHYLDLCY